MLAVIIFFLSFSLLLYVLLGGADFGAGIVELLSKRKTSNVVTKAIGPVWEANHIWLILVVVILFMGFPKIYTTISTVLHIPVTLMLVGIIIRGTAFTFRHYDAIHDHTEKYYSIAFRYSSLVTSFFIGIIAGAVILGKIDLEAKSFFDMYLAPWLNSFCVAMGIFVCCLFAFLSLVFLIGETSEPTTLVSFIRKARNANIAIVISGAFVFITAELNGFHLASVFLNSGITLVCVGLASLALPFLWTSLQKRRIILSRLLAGAQILFIMFGWMYIQYPVAVYIKGGDSLTFYNTQSPQSTMWQLTLALLIGSLFILPSFYYLMRIFKFTSDQSVSSQQ